MLSNEELAYIAGIIDGEGYIGLAKQKYTEPTHGDGFCYVLNVGVGMTEGVISDWLYTEFGGVLSYRNHKGNCRSSWDWRVKGSVAAEFLEKILPYLIVKKEKAELGLHFQSRRIPGKRTENGRVADNEDYETMRELNRRGREANAITV